MTVWETVTPLVDEPEQRAYWEPWQPQFGQRVRVRLSGECQLPVIIGRSVRGKRGHFDVEEGVTGTVRKCPNPRPCVHCESNRHPFVVLFNAPLQVPGATVCAVHYAACELEPL